MENKVVQLWDPILDWLEWRERIWLPLEEELKNLGFCWEKFIAEQPVCVGAYGELARIERAVANSLLTILTARLHKLQWIRINQELDALKGLLELARQDFTLSPLLTQLT